MKFIPKTEAEIEQAHLWPPGEYGFEVIDEAYMGSTHFVTCERTSKKGNEMIQLCLKVFNETGQFILVIDYLLAVIEYKLRHASAACGVLQQYETGELSASDFIGKTGFLKLRIDPAKDGYRAKNAVHDYAYDTGAARQHRSDAPHPQDDFADEIPL